MSSPCRYRMHSRKTITVSAILMVATLFVFVCLLVSDAFLLFANRPTGSSPVIGSAGRDPSRFTIRESQTVAYFSTVSSLILYDDFSDAANILRFEDVWQETCRVLEQIDQAVSVSVPTSDIARFNDLAFGDSVRISSHTANICKAARAAFDATGGMYDPTVYPLVDLWGFTPRFNTSQYSPALAYDRIRKDTGFDLPDEKYRKAFLQLVDYGNVVLSGDDQAGYTLTKRIPPVTVDGIAYNARIDFGGIAKGYAVECVTRLLQDRGYAYGSFSCGGSSIALLKNASRRSVENGTYRFALGLSKPRKGTTEDVTYMSVATKDVRLSSSGDYDHAYRIDDAIYCHLISPKTGYPANTPAAGVQKGIAVLTLLGGAADGDDAMTTALCVMGFEQALRFFNERLKADRMVMVLYGSGQPSYEVVTNIPTDEFSIGDPAYVLASHVNPDGTIVYDGSLMR